MAATVDATITNEGNSKSYQFRALAPLANRMAQPPVIIPLVNTSPSSTIGFRFVGQTENYTIQFAIFDDGEDTANGTHSSTVISVEEQIDYLKNHIFTPDFDTFWTFTQTRFASGGSIGFITDLEFLNEPGKVGVVMATMNFTLAGLGALP
jgi:hypothetical protein